MGTIDVYADAGNSGLHEPVKNWGTVDPFFSYGLRSDSGVRVDEARTLEQAPIWQGINVLSGDIGQLPLQVKRQVTEDTTEIDYSHNGGRLMRMGPSDIMRACTFREILQARALLHGNGLAWIRRDPISGKPVRMDPIDPRSAYPIWSDAGDLYIQAQFPAYPSVQNDGSSTETRYIPYADVLHIPSLTIDGIWGRSMVGLHRHTVGMSSALQKHGNFTFQNGAAVGGIVTRMQPWNDEDEKNAYRTDFESFHRGVGNTARVAFLGGGTTYERLAISNIDAQWIEARKYSREEAAALLGLPGYKVGDWSGAKWSNVAQMNRDYHQSALSRWLNKWREECNSKLLTPSQITRRSHWWEWNTNAFLSGDTESRYGTYEVAIRNRIISPNEARELEGMNPYEGGDSYENPNTSSGSTEEPPAEEQDPAGTEEAQQEQLAMKLFARECHKVARAEGDVVRKAARNPAKFLQRMEAYYGGEFHLAVADIIDTAAADRYAQHRMQDMLRYADGSADDLLSKCEQDSTATRVRARALVNLGASNGYDRIS